MNYHNTNNNNKRNHNKNRSHLFTTILARKFYFI